MTRMLNSSPMVWIDECPQTLEQGLRALADDVLKQTVSNVIAGRESTELWSLMNKKKVGRRKPLTQKEVDHRAARKAMRKASRKKNR